MPATHRADQEFADVGPLGRVPLATLGGRLAARLCDLAILFVPTYLVVAVVLGGSGWVVGLCCAAEMVLYDALLTARTGATPGKRIARIKVVDFRTGRPVNWGSATLRAFVLGALLWIFGAVSALADERVHRGLHDRAAGTVVIAA